MVMRPIVAVPMLVNHIAPWGPAAIAYGDLTPAAVKSARVPAGSGRRRRSRRPSAAPRAVGTTPGDS